MRHHAVKTMRTIMTTLKAPIDPESNSRVKAVFDDIRATRQTDFINNLWRQLAFDPPLLEATWAEVKRVMAQPSTLGPTDQRVDLHHRIHHQWLQLLRTFAHGCRQSQGNDRCTTCRT
jgi:alkylhydroperoxidase family enzyme